MAIIMDGKALAVNMQEQLQEKVARLKEKEWIVPGLVVIMVGENPASQVQSGSAFPWDFGSIAIAKSY